MTANNFRFEGYFGVKDGRKWKNRYCVFKQPTKFLDHFKLHLYKDREEYDSRVKSSTDVVPFEDVLGYEPGHHVDKDHPNCILMVGRKSTFFIGYPEFKQMIEWSQNLGSVLRCSFFRVTLESAENNRNLPRQAGTLHVQRSRICFIREPESSMSKLVCAWDVKEVKTCGLMPVNNHFFISAGTNAGKMRGKHVFSCMSGMVQNVYGSVSEAINDRVVFTPTPTQSSSSIGRSPPTSCPPACVYGPPTSINSHPVTQRRANGRYSRHSSSSDQHYPLPPPPTPPPHIHTPFEKEPTEPLPPPPPPPPASPPVNGVDNHHFPPRYTGSHEYLPPSGVVMRHEDDSLFPNATVLRSGKRSSPGGCSDRNPSLRHLTYEDDVSNGRRGADIFRRSNSLNIQSTKQDKTGGNILQRTCRLFKRRSRSETDFSGGSSSVGSASGTLTKDHQPPLRYSSVEADGDDEVFDENPLCSSASASSSPPEGLANSIGADVPLSPIREDRTPSGPGPSINPSCRTRSISASYTASQGMRLSSSGSTGTTENSTLKRNDTVDSTDESRTGDNSELVAYPTNPFPDWEQQRSYMNTAPQTIPSGYVTLPNTRKGGGLQRSHSTVSGSSYHSPASNTTHLMSAKPRFGNEYIPRQTLRSVSQSTGDSPGSPVSTTPAMACPMPARPPNHFADPMGSAHRHYVNLPAAMPGIIPSDSRSVAAKTGYVNLDMRCNDDYAQVDMRPGHSAPEYPADVSCSPYLHYAKLHFNARGHGSHQNEIPPDSNDSQSASYQHPQQRLSCSADPPRHSIVVTSSRSTGDYIEVDTSRTKALSKLVSEQTSGGVTELIESDDQSAQPPEGSNGSQGLPEPPIVNDVSSLRHASQDMIPGVHSSSVNSSNGGSSTNSNSSRNPSFRKIRNPFSNRKNSEPPS